MNVPVYARLALLEGRPARVSTRPVLFRRHSSLDQDLAGLVNPELGHLADQSSDPELVRPLV